MTRSERLRTLNSLHSRGFKLVPLEHKTKRPVVKWKDYQLTDGDLIRFLAQGANWAIRCDDNFHALDFDDPDTYINFVHAEGVALQNAPIVRTGRGYHIWFKPTKPVNSFSRDGIEVKGLGSLIVVPPSIHPSGIEYEFEKSLDGTLPLVDIEELLSCCNRSPEGKSELATNTPSDFALRYGKSAYPQSFCGRATKILTRSDARLKHLLSLRCWKWHCTKCAPLLRHYWMNRLTGLSFRFILRLPSMDKPTTFLRHLGKPSYAHIVSNGESWLFLTGGEAERVWSETQKAGYELIAGDISGDPTPHEVKECLEQALGREEVPLNTRRKITRSRGLFRKTVQNSEDNESKRNSDSEETEDISATFSEEQVTWNSEVVMKPIEEVARELKGQGWRVLWKSEVEAIAMRDDQLRGSDIDMVQLIEAVGIRLKKVGTEYMGLCPFHDDHTPSLSVNREKNVWHCFGCGKGGDIHRFIQEWQSHNTQ